MSKQPKKNQKKRKKYIERRREKIRFTEGG